MTLQLKRGGMKTGGYDFLLQIYIAMLGESIKLKLLRNVHPQEAVVSFNEKGEK